MERLLKPLVEMVQLVQHQQGLLQGCCREAPCPIRATRNITTTYRVYSTGKQGKTARVRYWWWRKHLAALLTPDANAKVVRINAYECVSHVCWLLQHNQRPGRSMSQEPRDNLAQESWNLPRVRAKPSLLSKCATKVRSDLLDRHANLSE